MRIQRSNEDWVLQLRNGSPEQQSCLVDLRAVLVNALRHGLSSYAEFDELLLEDAVQSSLVRIVARLDQFEGRSAFLTWATAIAIRVAMCELRRRCWQAVPLERLAVCEDLWPDQQMVIQWEVTSEQREVFATAIAAISSDLCKKQRIALIAELRGMPLEQIAPQLGGGRNAIHDLIHDARKRLKRRLEDSGYEASRVRIAISP